MDTPEKIWGERRPKDKMTLQIGIVFTCLKTFTQGNVSLFDKCLHRPHVSVKKYIYTATG
jgi:hypothetical protein